MLRAGLLQSAFILSYALVSPLAGWLGDRFARLKLAAAGVLVWSVATIASGLAPTYAALLFARTVIGVGEASYAVVTPSLLSDLYAPERRARVFAIFYAALPVGTALGYALGGTVGGTFGWRAAFFVAGIPGAVLALVLLGLAEPKRGATDPPGTAPATPQRSVLRSGRCGPGGATSTTRARRCSTRSRWEGWRRGCRPTTCASAAWRSARRRPRSGSCCSSRASSAP